MADQSEPWSVEGMVHWLENYIIENDLVSCWSDLAHHDCQTQDPSGFQDFFTTDSESFHDLILFVAKAGLDNSPHYQAKDLPHQTKTTELIMTWSQAVTKSLKETFAVSQFAL